VSGSRPVYQTGKGRLCPRCGWPVDGCRCSKAAEEPVPARIACVLRLERKGRGGKTVTVLAGLPRNAAFLAGVASELRRACGTGGTATDEAVEIQGDHRERLRTLLAAKGWTVRG
jgi:translation initiation factor 1